MASSARAEARRAARDALRPPIPESPDFLPTRAQTRHTAQRQIAGLGRTGKHRLGRIGQKRKRR